MVVKDSARSRMSDSVETALELAQGLVVIERVDLDAADPQRERAFPKTRLP